MKRQLFRGYLGGSYEKLGLWDNQKDAERGLVGGEYLHELLEGFNGKFVRITVEEVDAEDIREQRLDSFIEKYEEAFGEKPKLKPKLSDEEKIASGKYGVTLNYYGIKSDWM